MTIKSLLPFGFLFSSPLCLLIFQKNLVSVILQLNLYISLTGFGVGHMRDTKTKGWLRVMICVQLLILILFIMFFLFPPYRDVGVGNPYRTGY